MKLRKIYSSEYYPCEGEKRLAKAVIYRAMKDVLNYHEQSCFSEGKLTLLDIKKIIRWVYKDTEIKCSFLYWAEHATDVENLCLNTFFILTLIVMIQ